jgi:hypothetical protein
MKLVRVTVGNENLLEVKDGHKETVSPCMFESIIVNLDQIPF